MKPGRKIIATNGERVEHVRLPQLPLYLEPRTGLLYAAEATEPVAVTWQDGDTFREERAPGVLRLIPVGPRKLEAERSEFIRIGDIDREAIDG